jgi:hypothetical protein
MNFKGRATWVDEVFKAFTEDNNNNNNSVYFRIYLRDNSIANSLLQR